MKQLSPQEALDFISSLNTFAILDKDGRYTYVSKRWCEMTGHTEENVLGQRVDDLFPDTMAMKVLETGQPITGHPVKIGDTPIFTNYSPRLSPSKKIIGCFLYTIFHGEREAQLFENQLRSITQELNYYKKELSKERGAKYTLKNIIGTSAPILHLKEQIEQAAASSSTVLIEGETGTGKELIAHSIHSLSRRATASFVRVNCSAIPEDLMESEFFGYTSGAFTGALKGGKDGRFLVANHGSLFLDEVNLLPLTMQPKFLRTLQEHEITPIGSAEALPIDVRILAATNVPLDRLVAAGKFRMDLYFRLNVIRIQAPPLRSHKEDIPLLTEHILTSLNLKLGTFIRGIEPSGMDYLMELNWPGNIRELQNCLESAMNNCNSDMLTREDLMSSDGTNPLLRRYGRPSYNTPFTLKELRTEFEKNVIADTLKQCQGNKKRTAQVLGISRTVLYEKLNEYDLA